MSYYFNIKTQSQVTYFELNEKLNNPRIGFYQSPANLTEPILNTKVYIKGKSTRGVSIYKNDNTFSVGINVIASEDDFYLAINTTKAIAHLTNGDIYPEDHEGSINIEELTIKFDQNWIDDLKTLAVETFLGSIGKDKHVLVIGCCYMNYRIGPKIHETLDDTNTTTYYNSLVRYIQETQFFELNKYQIPSVIVSSKQDGTNRKSYVVFYPSGAQFLAYADYVVFPMNGGRYYLNYNQIELIADSKFKRLDEEQYLIEPLTENEYLKIIDKIEVELSNIDEETISSNYEVFTNDELNDEFDRLKNIPDARVKIFALQRMALLINEYEKRNIPLPLQDSILNQENIQDDNSKSGASTGNATFEKTDLGTVTSTDNEQNVSIRVNPNSAAVDHNVITESTSEQGQGTLNEPIISKPPWWKFW